MLRMLKVLPLATMAMLGAAAWAPLPKADTALITRVVDPVTCYGDRRNYRNFNHCWAVNIRRSTPSAVSRYCSRICS
jgi:hypothetical protein